MKKRSPLKFAAAAVLSAGLLMAQAPAPATPGQGAPGQSAPGQWMQRRLDKVATLLNLTDAQKTQIQSILQQSFTEAKPLMQQMRTNRNAIEQAIKNPGAEFDAQIKQLANTQGSLVSQLTVIHAKAFEQVWNLLTPDQQQKAESLRGLFGPMGMMGGGRGPGMGMHGMHGPNR